MNFQVSVIIPVFNASKFLNRAVQSVLEQPQVFEVILIEDGSKDNSLSICKSILETNPKIKLFQHPNGLNKGAAESRNLGIKKASQKFISFLDADDFMLRNRFEKTLLVFKEHQDAEGVYEAVDVNFETIELKKKWLSRHLPLSITVKYHIPPERLFKEQSPVGNSGFAHINGWTVKRSVFNKTGTFNSELLIHQDTDIFIRFSIASRMYPGEIVKPVAIYWVHHNNRITKKRSISERFYFRIKMWYSSWKWAQVNGYHKEENLLLSKIVNHYSNVHAEGQIEGKKINIFLLRYTNTLKLCPELKFKPLFYIFTIRDIIKITLKYMLSYER